MPRLRARQWGSMSKAQAKKRGLTLGCAGLPASFVAHVLQDEGAPFCSPQWWAGMTAYARGLEAHRQHPGVCNWSDIPAVSSLDALAQPDTPGRRGKEPGYVMSWDSSDNDWEPGDEASQQYAGLLSNGKVA